MIYKDCPKLGLIILLMNSMDMDIMSGKIFKYLNLVIIIHSSLNSCRV
jgi:hypothetical protein